MKKAFTMMELVFVIVIIGILAAVIIPRMEREPLREAAVQLVHHIRYAQHLALVNDKYDATNANWFKSRWQVMFEKTKETDNQWVYTIFSDTIGGSTGHADSGEIATNPSNKAKKLTGGTTSIHYDDAKATKSMNLGNSYGVTNVRFSPSCQFYRSQRIAFDHLGRPLIGDLSSYTSPYPTTASRLLSSDCNITLEGAGESVTITITPETGYAYIAN